MRSNKLSFNRGEISPKLFDRVDLEQYVAACRNLENFIVTPYGPVNRRGGLEYLGAAEDETAAVRLFPFNYSTTTAFIIEAGDQYFRFWSNGELVESAPSTPLVLGTPYSASDLFEIQFVQVNDVMFFVHQNYPIQALVRYSDTNWVTLPYGLAFPPVQDRTYATTMTPSAVSGSGVTITAGAATFNSSMVGGTIALYHTRSSGSISLALTANGTSSQITFRGSYSLATFGSWGPGTLILQKYVGGQWTNFRIWASSALNERNISATGTSEDNSAWRIQYTGSGSSGAITRLEIVESEVEGWADITGYTDSTHITVTVRDSFESTSSTTAWALGSWGPYQGYPRAIAYHEQRLYLGGTARQPTTIWASAIGDFNNFRYGVNGDDGFSIALASVEQHVINWMQSQTDNLAIGTSAEEWLLSPTDDSLAIGPPANFKVQQASRFGSKHLQAWVANDRLMFVQRLGRKIREFAYSFTSDSWESVDITLLSEHVSGYGMGFKQIAFEQQPDAIVWGISENEQLVGMTYERKQNVYGWHRQTTRGAFESVACIYGAAGDEVYVIVRREIDGSTRRYIERIDTGYLDALEDENKSRWFYVDAGKYVDLGVGNESATLSGLDHLEGETVSVLGDGNVYPDQVVSSGSITISEAVQVWCVGLPYVSDIHPVGIEVQQQDGTSQGRRWRLAELWLNVYKSLGGQVEVYPGEWDDLSYRDTSDVMDSNAPAKSGLVRITIGGSYRDTLEIGVRQIQPLPMSIISMIPKFTIYGE